jgi:hypothetical protein
MSFSYTIDEAEDVEEKGESRAQSSSRGKERVQLLLPGLLQRRGNEGSRLCPGYGEWLTL